MRKNYFDLYFYKHLKNTNDHIKHIYKSNKKKSNIALYCIEQEEGRGRKNREWISKKGDLTCSFLIEKKININDLGKINLFTIYYLIKIFNELGINKNISYKWPNDILINKKKIGGVLIETNVSNNLINKFIVGIGINFLPKSINSKFSSISFSDLGNKSDSLQFFFLMIENFNLFIDNFSKIEFETLSKNLSEIFFRKESKVIINLGKQNVEGIFEKINSSGEILLRNMGKQLKVNYGEII